MAAAFLSASSPVDTLPYAPNTVRSANSFRIRSLSSIGGGLRLVPKISITRAAGRLSLTPGYSTTTISCSTAQPETLQTVQSIIAKQLSTDESTVSPQTKFADLGADSLDSAEIMMALEEKFGVAIGEGGAENISTVQDAAGLIEKVKVDSA